MARDLKVDPFAIVILIISFIGFILLLATPFAGLYFDDGYYYGYGYSCFSCFGYSVGGDVAMQAMVLIFFIVQIVIAINELLPKKFINFDKMNIIGIALAGATILLTIIGLAIFGGVYEFDNTVTNWWPEAGFYGGVVGGIVNLVMFILKFKEVL
ncbi:MAG: hypothetical protein ACFFEN_12130 [Candidatus Thorarchaeota archaeon]